MKRAMKSTHCSDGGGTGVQSRASSPVYEARDFPEEMTSKLRAKGEVGVNHTDGGGEEDLRQKKDTGGWTGWAEGGSRIEGVQHHVRWEPGWGAWSFERMVHKRGRGMSRHPHYCGPRTLSPWLLFLRVKWCWESLRWLTEITQRPPYFYIFSFTYREAVGCDEWWLLSWIWVGTGTWLGLQRVSGEEGTSHIHRRKHQLQVIGCIIVFYFSFFVFFFLSRYASLYFCCAVENQDNELLTLEVVHRYVELLDKYFGNVSAVLVYLELFPLSALTSVLPLSHAFSLSSLKYELHLHKDQNTRHSPTSHGSL